MNNEKLSLDDVLEFILNGDDSELESLSEDFDAEDFDVPAVVTDDLENKNSYVWEKKSFRNIDKSFSEPQVAPPPKEKNETPYEYFSKFIDSDMIENICTQTNLYHLQKSGKEGYLLKLI